MPAVAVAVGVAWTCRSESRYCRRGRTTCDPDITIPSSGLIDLGSFSEGVRDAHGNPPAKWEASVSVVPGQADARTGVLKVR